MGGQSAMWHPKMEKDLDQGRRPTTFESVLCSLLRSALHPEFSGNNVLHVDPRRGGGGTRLLALE